MRWSELFIPTLRDDPAEAEAVSHKLLVRAGFMRQLAAGHYSMLPLGQRVRAKVAAIIQEEMDAIGGQRFHLPAMHPAELWKRSGRWEVMGEEMFRLVDRKGADVALGMTHEEVFALLATELFSYKDLPQIWYQIQTKFRDEPRPKSGLLRVREFTMKDSYSLDVDEAGLDAAFERHRAAYQRIFARFGLQATDVMASSGAMGGSDSVEFMVRSPAGEDWIVTCDSCDYRSNLEKATSRLPEVDDPASVPEPSRFHTPDLRTIKSLAEAFPQRAQPDSQIKTLVYMLGDQLTLVLLRGDHDLLEQKLIDATGVVAIRPAQTVEIVDALGAQPGSLGSVAVKDLPVIADRALAHRRGMVTGANEDDWHLADVDVDRDIAVTTWAELRTVRAGEMCPECGGTLDLWKGIEVGHIFKLGTKYSAVMEADVQDENGDSHPIVMGSYGIGVERSMAAIVESSHDEHGIIWPVSVAPYEVVITVVRPDDDATAAAASTLHRALGESGIEVVLDDRPARPGMKFADAELVGIPYRITVGPKGIANGVGELTTRQDRSTIEVSLDEIAKNTIEAVEAQRGWPPTA